MLVVVDVLAVVWVVVGVVGDDCKLFVFLLVLGFLFLW